MRSGAARASEPLLEESIEGLQADMKRRAEAGMKPACEKICQGIIVGLHQVNGTNDDGPLGWAPDFPAEAATWSLKILLELYPQRQRRAAGKRIIRGVEKQAADRTEMLNRTVDKVIAANA